MKRYGANKATEFTRKQVGVIFGMAKRGELKVQKFVMNNLYDLADYYGYDDNGSVEESESRVLGILESVFAGNIQTAQERIDRYAEFKFERMSAKHQKSANREFV